MREARARAGLTRRDLARRAGTAQSVVAGIEQRRSDPSTATLTRPLAAAGFELRAELTPAAQLLEVRNVSRFEVASRRA